MIAFTCNPTNPDEKHKGLQNVHGPLPTKSFHKYNINTNVYSYVTQVLPSRFTNLVSSTRSACKESCVR